MTAPTYGSASADTGVGPQPKNQIVVSGKPDVQYLNIETATNCYPGRLVKKGTHDNDVVVCTAGAAAIGVLGYEQAAKMYRPATRDTIYVQNDQAPVLSGKAVVLLYLAQSQTVAKGDKLVAAADGMVSKASEAAIPNSSTPVTSTSAQPTVTGPISTEGIALAEAEESVTTVDVEGWIMARMLI